MKYPLALVNKILEVFGSDIAFGYDIACAFLKTLMNSSLGPLAQRLRITGVAPCFHGHAHCRECQVHWHPLHIEGAGKEDFEGCERAFSASNSIAAATRLSSVFHRQQAIEQHWAFWSEDKNVESGKLFVVPFSSSINFC